VEGKIGNEVDQFDILNVMAKLKISFQSIRQYARFIWEVTSERMEANKVLDSLIIQNEGLTVYIPRYMFIKKRVIEDGPKDMKLENLMQRLNSDNHKKNTPYPSRLLTQSYLR
jgi:hypothetical protein